MRADRGQLEQVITNLALNARDAMPSGGSVELAVRRIDGEVELTVADSGIGMDAETIEHAFEPFFTTKGPGKGTGLGLATVYGIVTQTGGEISIDSRPGEGSTFRVVLPLSPDPAAVPVVREERAVAPTGTEGVLVAEDEQTIRRLVGEVLDAQRLQGLLPRRTATRRSACSRSTSGRSTCCSPTSSCPG